MHPEFEVVRVNIIDFQRIKELVFKDFQKRILPIQKKESGDLSLRN